ncbi:MAG: (Fe-S)-binding protein [Myxococcales bacterium]|nr:(Fe-S)-binding protein [Myxococcales bacterium]
MLNPSLSPAETCVYCPNLCLHACPVSNAEQRNTVSPWAKMSLVHWLERGNVNWNVENAAILYKCTGCGACQSACAHGVDVARTLMLARQQAVEKGVSPYSKELFVRPNQTHREFDAESVDDSRTLLFVGCHCSDADPKVESATVAVLNHLGFGPVRLGPGICCGYPLLAGGYRESFVQQAHDIVSSVGRCEFVAVGAGVCHQTLLHFFPEVGVSVVNVVTVIELALRGLIREDLPISTLPGHYAWHESCAFTRRSKLRDTTRQLLARLLTEDVAELRWSGESSHCCGAAGGFCRTSPDSARQAGANILQMAKDTGASSVVSFDPQCAAHLRASSTDKDLLVVDGIVLIAQSLGLTY